MDIICQAKSGKLILIISSLCTIFFHFHLIYYMFYSWYYQFSHHHYHCLCPHIFFLLPRNGKDSCFRPGDTPPTYTSSRGMPCRRSLSHQVCKLSEFEVLKNSKKEEMMCLHESSVYRKRETREVKEEKFSGILI